MIIRSNALALPLRDACVDLIVTSPPYFALRSYQDDGAHYEGQMGSEETPGAFVDALIEATREMARVLKPTGSIFVNLGDKYAQRPGQYGAGFQSGSIGLATRPGPRAEAQRSARKTRVAVDYGIPAKSLMGLPWRYALGCIDQLGLILRAEIIWSKPNSLPESVTDRVRRTHEQWFHFTKRGRYFTAMDEIREPHSPTSLDRYRYSDQEWTGSLTDHSQDHLKGNRNCNPLGNPSGKLPGSVWTITAEPLMVPDAVTEHYDLPDHFAAFPQEWPRRLILGWSPSGICTKCGEGRRPLVEKELVGGSPTGGRDYRRLANGPTGGPQPLSRGSTAATITDYGCACDVPMAPTRPAVVLDPFGGTGTVAMVARALGRTGLNCDLSGDYCRLARWRIYESGHAAKSEDRTWRDAQGAML